MTTSRADLPQATELPGHPARREPLLWLQLLGLAALPLEAVLLVLVLAGADPGPWPALERLLAWALGGMGTAFLFWRLPPDLWSLLLLQVPLRGRRPDQLRLSALQGALPLQLLTSAGVALSLPLIWWADGAAGLAWSWSPLAGSSRLVGLLVAALVLALLQWQWHQLVQALWMLSRQAERVAATPPLSQAEAADRRLSLGLPLLLLAPLQGDPQPRVVTTPSAAARPDTEGANAPVQPAAEAAQPQGQLPDLESEPGEALEPPAPSEEPDGVPGSTAAAESGQAQGLGESIATAEPEESLEPGELSELHEPATPSALAEPIEAVDLDPSTAPAAEATGESAAESAPVAAASVDLPVGEPSLASGAAAVLPEQQAEQDEGPDLDQQV